MAESSCLPIAATSSFSAVAILKQGPLLILSTGMHQLTASTANAIHSHSLMFVENRVAFIRVIPGLTSRLTYRRRRGRWSADTISEFLQAAERKARAAVRCRRIVSRQSAHRIPGGIIGTFSSRVRATFGSAPSALNSTLASRSPVPWPCN